MTQGTTKETMTPDELFDLATGYLDRIPEGYDRARAALVVQVARAAFSYRAYRQLADGTERHRYDGLRIEVTGALVKSLYEDMDQQEVAALIRENDAFVVPLDQLANLFTMARHCGRAARPEATQPEPSL